MTNDLSPAVRVSLLLFAFEVAPEDPAVVVVLAVCVNRCRASGILNMKNSAESDRIELHRWWRKEGMADEDGERPWDDPEEDGHCSQ